MSRDTALPLALLIAALGVLGAGVWMWFGMTSTERPAATEHTDAAPAETHTATPADELTEKRFAVPDCPVALKLDRSFRKQPIEASRPALRLRSERRLVQIDVDCRRSSAENFDPDQFLHDIYRGMELKHKDAVEGRTPIEMKDGEVLGSSIKLRDTGGNGSAGAIESAGTSEGRVTYNNVMVRDRTIVMLKVGGPVGQVTRSFNDGLLEQSVVWSD